MDNVVDALQEHSDWPLKLGIASAIPLSSICARKLLSLIGINELKIIIFVLCYLTILVYIKLTIHLSVSGQG